MELNDPTVEVLPANTCDPDCDECSCTPSFSTAPSSPGLLEVMNALNKGQQCIKQMDGNGISDSIAQGEEELKIGMRVSGEDEAYSLYNTYAFHKGFSIRKAKIRRSQDGSIKQREYVCSKEGFSLYDDPYTTNKVERSDRPDTRTGCKAGVRFNVEDGVWTIVHFIPEHNHPLAKPEERQNLRSQWRLPKAKEIAFRSKLGQRSLMLNM